MRLPVHEGVQLTAPEYRNRLYQVLGNGPLRPLPSSEIPSTLHAHAAPL